MKKLVALMFILLLTGCNTSNGKSNNSNDSKISGDREVNVKYPGDDRGCKAIYNPFYCGDEYIPTNLQSSDAIVGAFKDSSGNVFILDKNETLTIEKLLGNKLKVK